jgi:hypothetical protein
MDKELLFLLIIIVTVVINIIKAVNKKKGAQPSSATPPPVAATGQEDWQEILRKMFGEKEAAQNMETSQWEEPESLETLVPLGGSMEEVAPFSYQEPQYSKSSLSMEAFDVSPSTWTDADDLTKQGSAPKQVHHPLKDTGPFDIRKAVIFSTILERPYA